MGYGEESGKGIGGNVFANLIQFFILLVTIVLLAMHGEGRLARIEQKLSDMDVQRNELVLHLDRVENRLDGIKPLVTQ
jgi:hypothetical protein